tara:strand:- start:1488 stop:2294 length:807 start_codon:yes stop_codon:yes gene_type:complete
MAYPKITVNTGQVVAVVPSDTIPIPNPNFLACTGVGNFVVNGANSSVSADKLVDAAVNFNSTVTPLPVVATGVKDVVYNLTDPSNANVDAIDSNTQLSLSADIFSASPENYIIVRQNALVDDEVDFLTSGVQVGDIVLNTDARTIASVTAVVNADQLTLSANIFGTNLTYDDNFRIYSQAGTGLQWYPAYGGVNGGSAVEANSEGCLIYVSDQSAAAGYATEYYNVTVRTVAGDIVTFYNAKVGTYLPVQVVQVMASGTTCDGLLAIW